MKIKSLVGIIFFLCTHASAAPLPFDQALTQIISRSTSVQTAEANVGFTEANAIPATFQFVPSITLDATKTRSEDATSNATTNTGVEAVVKYNLFHWGADVENLSAAHSDVKSQKSTLENTHYSVEDAGVAALVAEIQNKKTIEIDQGIVDIQSNLLKVAKERFAKGYLASQEVDKISVDLDNAKASLSDAKIQEANSRANLENLLGSAEIAPEWPWKERFQRIKLKILEEKLNLPQVPDYLAAESHDQAEDSRYQRTKLLLLPSLDANFTYGYYNGFDTISGASYSSGALTPSWTAGVVVSWPIFDHLITYSAEKAQSYVSAAADVALVQKERDLNSAWESSRDNFKIAMSAAIAREKTLETSRKIYQDSLRRAQAGRISANDFVIDQQRLLNSELFAVQGWAIAHLQFPKLCHALGRRLEKCWE